MKKIHDRINLQCNGDKPSVIQPPWEVQLDEQIHFIGMWYKNITIQQSMFL